MKIGYQGIEGSYSNIAAVEFAKKLNLKNYELVPLINSMNVVNSLVNYDIDYGVFAINNSTAGVVIETKTALTNRKLRCLDKLDLEIRHCLFMKKKTNKDELNKVVSHEQALAQTRKTRNIFFNNLEEIEYSDTALAARDLANNTLDSNCSVICSKIAGEIFNLELLYEGLNDMEDNLTTFGIYTK